MSILKVKVKVKVIVAIMLACFLTSCAVAVVGGVAGATTVKKYKKNKKEESSKIAPSETSNPGIGSPAQIQKEPSSEDQKLEVKESTPASDNTKVGDVFEGEASSQEDACLAANLTANFNPKYPGKYDCTCKRDSELWLCSVYP